MLGVPLATSIQAQAKEVQAAELHTVGLACAMAAHTSTLLQELDIGKPISLRVLTGGFLASQLGLSKQNRHIELWSRMGQFQLSKIASSQNLAASLTHKLSASGLSRLLPKLKVHTRPSSGVALLTGLRAEQAFFVGSSSFYIGMLTKHPAQLDLSELEQDAMAELQSTACSTELSGQEIEKQNNLPKLEGIRTYKILLRMIFLFIILILIFFNQSSLSFSFIQNYFKTTWDLELDVQADLLTSFGQKELEKNDELPSNDWKEESELYKPLGRKELVEQLVVTQKLWKELAEQLADKLFRDDQLQQILLELEVNKNQLTKDKTAQQA